MNLKQGSDAGLDFSQAEVYQCDRCGNDRFTVQYIIRKFSALLSPTGQEMIVPMQVFSCTECNHINDDFLPSAN